jgi:hypothetical protein
MPLFYETPEHAYEVQFRKDVYLSMNDQQRCLGLVIDHNKEFDYETTLELQPSLETKGEYIANLERNSKGQYPYADFIVSMTLNHPVDTAISRTRLEIINDDPSCNTPICISDSESSNIYLPNPLPLVALTFANVRIRIESNTYPGTIKVRYRLIPLSNRRGIATCTHYITKHVSLQYGRIHAVAPSK